jgi:membrane-associated protease RseP (regulator of RpoE activity)
MNNPFTRTEEPSFFIPAQPAFKERYWLHALLFALTLASTTLAGAELITGRTMEQLSLWEDFSKGLPYSLSFLCFLTFHEFGHYFTAVYHGVKTSLPYYIPIYLPFSIFNIGSMGAVIRMRETPGTTRKYFDIGIAGPLAGFVIALFLLWYGFAFMPGPEYLYGIHPEYSDWFGGKMPSDSDLQNALKSTGAISIELGNSLIFQIFRYLFADPEKMPGAMEMYHYPYLFVGYLTLFFTALNLLPIGQLDGGHVTYGLFGIKIAALISRITVIFLVTYGGLGIIDYSDSFYLVYLGLYGLYIYYVMTKILGNSKAIEALAGTFAIIGFQYLAQEYWGIQEGGTLWLVYSFIAVRVIGLDHPPARVEEKLNPARIALGIVALLIFVLCFTPDPLKIIILEPALPLPIETPQEAEEIVVSILRGLKLG